MKDSVNCTHGRSYYQSGDLKRFGEIAQHNDRLAAKFFDYYNEVFKAGTLTAREKSLIALAVAHAVQCPYCIEAYTTDCIEKGADERQMMEAIHVTAAIRGGASLVHGVQMMTQAEKLSL